MEHLIKIGQITIRPANESDKDAVISFCTNTFSWGDYIAEVWDIWLNESDGMLFVAESSGQSIGLAHASLCPNKQGIWLEGVRVRADFRRSGIASNLLNTMLAFGAKNSIREALAVVAAENAPSRRMLEKSNFTAITEWSYFSSNHPPLPNNRSNARLATNEDIDKIQSYLHHSEIFRKSAERYVTSWRWYRLDRLAVERCVHNCSLIVTGDPIDGLAIVNVAGYWDRGDVLQIVYIDSSEVNSISDILNYVENLRSHKATQKLHVLCHKSLANYIEKFEIDEAERFLVYRKELLPAS